MVLPLPVGSGHQNHSVRLVDVAPELLQVGFGKTDDIQAQRPEFFADRFLVENTDDRIFAVNRRHDRNAEVDRASLVARLEASVLRNAALGNVEFRHDLDARNDRRVMFLGDRRHRFGQRAVDAVLHTDFGVARFNVNIAGSPLERREDDRVDQADDRAGFFLRDLFDRDRFVAALIFTNELQLETFGRLFQHALRGFRLLQQILNFGKRRNLDDQRRGQAAPTLRRSRPDRSDPPWRRRAPRLPSQAGRSCSGTSDRPESSRNSSRSRCMPLSSTNSQR